MTHGRPAAALVAVFLLVGASPVRTRVDAPTLDACKLLSEAEASTLAGVPLAFKRREANATAATCVYEKPGSDPLEIPKNHVEIGYYLSTDAAAAHANFLRRVHPGPKPMYNTTITTVSGIGDEAAIKRTPSFHINSMDLRRGTAVVSLGVSPIVGDEAFKAAARKVLARL